MKKIFIALFFVLLIHFFFLVNLRFTAWPEMFSFPYLKNNGFDLYKDMVHPYPPILTLVLSFLYKIFGYKLWVLQASTWWKAIFNDILIFLIAKKLTKSEKAAILSVIGYTFLHPFLEGNQMWFDFAITTPILIGLLFALNKKYFLAGVLFADAAFIKQTGGLFFLVYLFWLGYQKVSLRNFLAVLISPLFFAIPLLFNLIKNNSLVGFFNWVIYYPSKYWTKFPGYIDLFLDKNEILTLSVVIFPALVSLIIIRKKLNKDLLLLILFNLVGFVSIYPRFSFFHFQTVLPFLVIFYSFLYKLNLKTFIAISIGFATILFFKVQKPLLVSDWHKPARFLSQEDLDVGTNVPSNDSTYLLGYQSGVYVFSELLPPKPWVDNYAWYYEIPNVENEVISQWTGNPPQYILWKQRSEGNWFDIGTYQPQKLVKWIKENYNSEGQNLWKRKS